MKKQILYILLFLLLVACNKNSDKIQVPVFGNLILGAKVSDYFKKLDTLKNSKGIFFNEKKYPYFLIEKEEILSMNRLLLFPFIIHNSDSIITKICFYPYYFEFSAIPQNIPLSDNDKQAILSVQTRESNAYINLLSSFTIDASSRGLDYYQPSVPSNSLYPRMGVIPKIEKIIRDKYGDASDTIKVGNVSDRNSDGSLEYRWNLEKINIRLISKKYAAGVYDFYNVLIYEFNDKIKEEYKLNTKKSDLNNTF